MSEEIRISKVERQRALERVSTLEKMSVSQAEEHHRLQTRYKELKKKLKIIETSDVEVLRQANIQMEIEISKQACLIQVYLID